jgi:DNA-binding NarL/FixJ family response regulator
MNDTPVRLMLVDDHPVIRLGLSALFQTVPHFEVVGEAATAADAIATARSVQPDVVILDVRLPDGDGAEVCREMRSERPDTRVIMLTSYANEDAVLASIAAGANGYFLKETDPDRLVECVNVVARDGSLLDPTITRVVLNSVRLLADRASDDPLAALNEQERRILPLLAEGKTNREIGRDLCLSENTVKWYVSDILGKLSLRRRSEAAAFVARRQGATCG